MWTLQTCEIFLEWCHVGKVFPLARHSANRMRRAANLKYCTHDGITERCIQVHQHLYGEAYIPRNEVTYSILRMVYAEVELGRVVDWRSMRSSATSKVMVPDGPSIPLVRRFPEGGLGRIMATCKEDDDDIQWSATSSDDDKTGCPSEVRRDVEQAFKGRWLDRALHGMAAMDEVDGYLENLSGPAIEGSPPRWPRSPRTNAYIADLEEELRQCRLEKEESKVRIEEDRITIEKDRKKIEELQYTILEKEETISFLRHERFW